MKLLHIDSSITGANSASRQLSASIVRQWRAANPEAALSYLDLAAHTPPHLSQDALGFRQASNEGFTAAQTRENQISEELVQQFLDADVVIIGVPLYNFTIPSQLKAWIDRIAQPGRTFRYTENGVQGLASNKTIILALTRGGVYSDSPAGQAMEHQESYLQTIFGFFGVTDLRIVRAEGTALGPEIRDQALRAAEESIAELVLMEAEAA